MLRQVSELVELMATNRLNGGDMADDDEISDAIPREMLSRSKRHLEGRSRRMSSDSMSRSMRDLASGSLGRAAGLFAGGGNPLENAALGSSHADDEEALRWAALEKLPTYNRVRTSIFYKQTGSVRQVDVQKDLSTADMHHLLHKLHHTSGTEEDHLLVRLRKRLDRLVCTTHMIPSTSICNFDVI